MNFFATEKKTAFEAKATAQWIAYGPAVFQAARVLRNSGILKVIEESKTEGLAIEEIAEKVKLPVYGVRVLLESGLSIGLVLVNEKRYTIAKTGHFILNDPLTKANMDFVQDVCYQGIFNLENSIVNGKPEGLKVFGNWKTVYEALSQLPEKTRQSWLAYDHFYSDNAFPEVLPLVFNYKPRKLLDIGGNTGKWSIACRKHSASIEIGIVDLPGQVNLAKENMKKSGSFERLTFYGIDILSPDQKLPYGYDAIWMSQFLDCFSETEIKMILSKCFDALDEHGHVFILEPLWDKQEFEAAAFSIQQLSIYFTAIANGNSRMYKSTDFNKLINESGFEIESQTDQIGICQSLIVCRKTTKTYL